MLKIINYYYIHDLFSHMCAVTNDIDVAVFFMMKIGDFRIQPTQLLQTLCNIFCYVVYSYSALFFSF